MSMVWIISLTFFLQVINYQIDHWPKNYISAVICILLESCTSLESEKKTLSEQKKSHFVNLFIVLTTPCTEKCKA